MAVVFSKVMLISAVEVSDDPHWRSDMQPDKRFFSTDSPDTSCAALDKDRSADQRAPENRADRRLSSEAIAWLKTLPREVMPYNLATHYPRICNRMVERWKYADLMIPYFDDLLMDRRGGRQGFPITIVSEIAALQAHYRVTVSATKDEVWNRVTASPMF